MKKIVTLISLSLFLICFSNLYIGTASASELPDQTTDGTNGTDEVTPLVSYITISQLPAKTTYEIGQNLDLTGMVVQAFYLDGTSAEITDYQIIGYNNSLLGSQTIFVSYQNYMAALTVTVVPAKVMNVTTTYHDTTTITLSWDAIPSAIRYEVYELDEMTGTYELLELTYTNSITLYYPPGTIQSFRICAVEDLYGIEYRGEMSEVHTTATNPEMVTNLVVTANTSTTISLSWDATAGATGYLIYRSPAASENYTLIGSTNKTSYTSNKLSTGTSYKFKVCAFTQNDTFTGNFSNLVDTSTTPAKISLKYKVGDQKIRFSWNKTNGATAYDIYVGDDIAGYTLLKSYTGSGSSFTYVAEGFTTGNTYTFYAVARRGYKGKMFQGPSSNLYTIEMVPIKPTSQTGVLFPTEAAFFNSYSYKNLPYFNKYVDVKRSFAIPGLATTNVGGFSSISMCPQGLTFAGDFLLMSAYDLASEENSVIYVMNKKTKELLTTMILPSKPHAGGLAFDGVNVWITIGSRVASFLFSDIEMAVMNGEPYAYITYNAVSPLGITASYMTYYQDKLWVGTYNELKSTYLYSYEIVEKNTIPSLKKVDTMYMPTRVQGVAFTKQGTLILSRSCQLYRGLRGYMRQIDVYKPNMKDKVNGVIQLGKLVNSVSMPSMNEDIAIDGNYLYVNFESAAFTKSTFKMDRICAFKLTDIVKKINK